MSRRRGTVQGMASNPIFGPARDAKEMPLDPGEVGKVMFDGTGVDEDKRTTFVLPTNSLKLLLSIARRENLPRQLPPEVEAKMRPSGHHFVGSLTLVTDEDGRNYVRGNAWLVLGDKPNPWAYIIDLPAVQVGTILDAKLRDARRRSAKQEDHPHTPRWVGSHSFATVYSHLQTFNEALKRWPDDYDTSARLMLGDSAFFAMQRAHVICVPPEQAQVLPDWEDAAHVWDFAQDVMLPFEYLYLDFEGPGSIGTTVRSPSGLVNNYPTMTLRGAVVWRESDDSLVVAPVGWPDKIDHSIVGLHPGVPAASAYEPMGVCIFGAGSFVESAKDVRGGDSFVVRMALDDRPSVRCEALALSTDTLSSTGPTPGFVELPFSEASVRRTGMAAETITEWSQSIIWLASRVLAALSILEAAEVEIIDAPVEKRDRKRAEKRKWPIAQIVHVRSNRRYANANPASGDEAHYSHRFWVRAHTKHFPVGTRTADARPDLCKPCQRCGICRRVKTPAFIKGPEDAPLVLKSLITHRKETASA